MKKTTKYLALTLVMLMMTGVLASCQTAATPAPSTAASADPSTAASADPSESATTTPSESAEPVTQAAPKILREGLTGNNGNHMSIFAENVYDSRFCNLVFESLVDLDMSGSYVPELAASYEMSNENLTYTFTLKDGITFSDGTPLTSADVKFTYEMMAHPEYDGPRMYAVNQMVGYEEFNSGASDDFAGVQVIDEKTVSFTFNEGLASPANIEHLAYGILNKAYYEEESYADFKAKISTPGESGGSGPFILTEYLPNELVRFVKDPDYWDIANREPKIDEVVNMNVPDEQIIAALQVDQIDFGSKSANMDSLNAMEAVPEIVPYNSMANGYTYMAFNCVNGIFDDKLVRQAFLYGLDRKSFIEAEYGELASVGIAPISPVSWAFPDLGDMNDYAFDLERAASLLDEAGWVVGADGIREKDGRKLSVNWLVYTDNTWPGNLAGMASDSWGQIGIELNIELMDFTTTMARTQAPPPGEKDFDIYTMGFSLSPDPNPAGGLFDNDTYVAGGFDATGYRNEHAQDLIKQGLTEFDQAKRAEIYKEWAILMNEEVPTTLIAYRNELWGIRSRVKNMNINAFCDWSYSIFDIDIVE